MKEPGKEEGHTGEHVDWAKKSPCGNFDFPIRRDEQGLGEK
jgi:hypothetical protein